MHPLLDRFDAIVARQPTRLAAADQSLLLDYRSFHAVAGGLANQIVQATSRPHVGVLAPTSAACAAAIFACWRAGRVPVPLNFLLSPGELAKIVVDAGLDCLVTVEHFRPLAQALNLAAIEMNGRTLVPGSAAAPPCELRDIATIIYTSGTSGDPKGVCLTFANILGNADACIAHARMTHDQVFLSVLPQFHSFGFTAMTVVPLVLGASVWYLPRFSPAAVVSTIAEKKVTVFMAVASMYAALARMKTAKPADFESVQLAISGGEPLSRSVEAVVRERFGVQIVEGYGLTETSPVVSINVPWARRDESVGRPMPGIGVRAIDATGRDVPPGTDGELVVEGHCVMQGYHNQPDATRAIISDGALRTGDIGRVDADGFVFITGRAKEMLIIGGENVFPREIEQALLAHPAVAEAAVIGVRDELRGELPTAFVILNEGQSVDEMELRAFCRERVAGYKVPREIRIEKDLPRGPTGKILKRALKA